MDKLPQALILEILSRLSDSADVARCRLAWKTFDHLSSDLRSINLHCSLERYIRSRSRVSNSTNSTNFSNSPNCAQITIPFKRIFLDLVSNLRVVDSVRIGTEKPLRDVSYDDVEDEADDLYLTDGDFVMEWLPRVAGGLKSLSISDFWVQSCWRRSNLLPLVSAYCRNLLELEVKNAWLSVDNLNPMQNLTSLTLEFVRLDDDNLNELNRCFPSLQVLNLIGVGGLKLPTIQLPNLKTCYWAVSNAPSSLSLIAPSLVTLKLECVRPTALYIEAPMLANFHLALDHADRFEVRNFENLKTLWLECLYIGSLCFKFPLSLSVEHLTVDSRKWARGAAGYSNFTLNTLFTVFPTVSYLCINPSAWSELEACYNPRGWEIRRGRRALKTFRAYLLLVDPLLTFSSVASLVNQCKVLAEVSLFIHRDVVGNVSRGFMARCMNTWPGLEWKWGLWKEGTEDSWIPEPLSDSTSSQNHDMIRLR